MAIICSSYSTTISGSNSLVCGYYIKVYNINPPISELEILVNDIEIVDVSSGYNAYLHSNVIFSLHMVSKDIANNTAVIDMIVSDNPCIGVSCPDICVGNDLYTQRCNISYDLQRIPIGYTCVQDTIKTPNACSHLECVNGICTTVTGVGTNTCNTPGSTTECVVNYTDTLEIGIRPWGWYTPQTAADKILTKIIDLNGAITNYLSSITGYTYVRTDISYDNTHVIISIRLNETVSPAYSNGILPLIGQFGVGLIAAIVFTTIVIGITEYANYKKTKTDGTVTSNPVDPPPPKEIEPEIEKTVGNQNNICLTGLPPVPTCADLSTYAICLKASHVGVYGTLTAVYPNFTEFQITYNKYLDIYLNLVATCNPNVPGNTPQEIYQKIIEEQAKYIIQIQDDFKKLQTLYEQSQCCIELPFFGCAINKGICDTAKTVAYVIVGGIIIYILYDTYTKIQPMLNQPKKSEK